MHRSRSDCRVRLRLRLPSQRQKSIASKIERKNSKYAAIAIAATEGASKIQLRKIPAPIKVKSALPPPEKNQNTPPAPKRGISWTWRFSCRKNTEILGTHKIGAAISGPRIADKNLTDTRIFLIDEDPKHRGWLRLDLQLIWRKLLSRCGIACEGLLVKKHQGLSGPGPLRFLRVALRIDAYSASRVEFSWFSVLTKLSIKIESKHA